MVLPDQVCLSSSSKHREIWNFCRRTGKMHAKAPENFTVPSGQISSAEALNMSMEPISLSLISLNTAMKTLLAMSSLQL